MLDQKNLLQALKEQYSLQPTQIKSFGSIWKVFTSSDLYILKVFRRSQTELAALANTLILLEQAGFSQFIPTLPNQKGKLFWEFEAKFWSLSPWYNGQRPDFKVAFDLTQTATLLGKLHQTANTLDSCTREPLAHLLHDWETKLSFLKEIPARLNQPTINRIDRQTLNLSNHFFTQATSCYQALVPLADVKFSVGFCHHDPAPRNIIIYQNKWYLLDLEFSGRGYFLNELANLIRRALQLNLWAAWVIPTILNGYQNERPLTETETKVLPYLIAFPRQFWRFCHQRYYENLKRNEHYFAHRLWEITNAEKSRERWMLEQFP